MSAPRIQAIQTRYAGCHFRSRLEARWAVFFDTLELSWEYEPERYDLPHGRYLPDFWLPSLEAFYEVKGKPPTVHEGDLAEDLAIATGHRVFIASGDIPRSDHHPLRGPQNIQAWLPAESSCGWDTGYSWCECRHCGRYGIEFEGRADRICAATHGELGGHGQNMSTPIHGAYDTARSARFDKGDVQRRERIPVDDLISPRGAVRVHLSRDVINALLYGAPLDA